MLVSAIKKPCVRGFACLSCPQDRKFSAMFPEITDELLSFNDERSLIIVRCYPSATQ